MNIPDEFRPQRIKDGASALQHALNSEGAFTIGKLGRDVEVKLARLALVREGADTTAISSMLYECADAVWRYFVQREMFGLMNHLPVIESYGIPDDVLNKVGALPPSDL